MKRKIFLGVSAVVIATGIMFVSHKSSAVLDYDIYEGDVEALTACESIGWRNNDGNCVKNSSSGQYFCKDDSWHEITDCKQ